MTMKQNCSHKPVFNIPIGVELQKKLSSEEFFKLMKMKNSFNSRFSPDNPILLILEVEKMRLPT